MGSYRSTNVLKQPQGFMLNNEKEKDAARNLFDFLIHVRKGLEERLPIMNLRLLDLELKKLNSKRVLAPGAAMAFQIEGIVERPISKETKRFAIRIDLDPDGEAPSREELDPLINEIQRGVKEAFYSGRCL